MPDHAPGGETPAFFPDSYCGLYCGACPQYLATKADDGDSLGEERCQGCKSEVVAASWCRDCPHRQCARDKGLEFCGECPDYPCSGVQTMRDEQEWLNHDEVCDYMATIQEEGKEAWLCKMKERWSCPSCGTKATWMDLSCGSCGTELTKYTRSVPGS